MELNKIKSYESQLNQQTFLKTKIDRIQSMIQSTFTSLDYYKNEKIFSHSDVNICSETLQKLYTNIGNISLHDGFDKTVEILQQTLNRLASIFSKVGTKNIGDVTYVIFGGDYNLDENHRDPLFQSKIALINKFVWVTGYKSINTTEYSNIQCLDKITEYTPNIDTAHHMECFEPIKTSLHHSAYGLRIVVHNTKQNKSIILNGFVENIPIQCLDNEPFINAKLTIVRDFIRGQVPDCDENIIERWIHTFTLKDLMVYSECDFKKRYMAMLDEIKYIKYTPINTIIKRFMEIDIVSKRKMLIHLLIYNKDNEVQYIAYLLYDLIGCKQNATDDVQESVDNVEQTQLYNSFPWTIKQYFKESMTHTMQYTQDAFSQICPNSGANIKISLEQQILLLRANDLVKEKAIAKLKDIKGKTDDQGGKTKQYLEALVKIPFGSIRREPILDKSRNITTQFIQFIESLHILDKDQAYNIPKKNKYTICEIQFYLDKIAENLRQKCVQHTISILAPFKKRDLVKIHDTIKKCTVTEEKIKTKMETKKEILKHITQSVNSNPYNVLYAISTVHTGISKQYLTAKCNIDQLHELILDLDQSIHTISQRLDDSIYGHDEAKSQILKIVGQWINGEPNGYCFGFEGSPGIGKTSLAKRGLAQCLQDEHGVSRPFSFIALGGSCNGSTLEGHNFTYMNSTWGKIVDILMDSRCMNPIIYIDELDKVSKTEQGKEIIGILMHLIDTTQNDEFQDKYFSGIPLDLSKALFIFSYNDPDQIDRILLDRIHRIKFDNLSWKDKIVITKKFILNDLNVKMGFDNVIELSDEVIEYIIVTYTSEAGVRRLKEILFDLYGEINVELLRGFSAFTNKPLVFPIQIHINDLGTKYLKKYKKCQHKEIHGAPAVGIINGMWANSLGNGGIIPVEVVFFPTSSFLDLHLTGLQGDVMKESMNVAKTVAWSLTDRKTQIEHTENLPKTRNQGIHIHCPEGSVSKDGPSAGAAITLAIYSRLNNIPIRNDYAITGEINLQGDITAIGGLEAKILGSIRAGIKTIVYPESNQTDFEEFKTKYIELLDNISFIPVSHIREALPLFMMESFCI